LPGLFDRATCRAVAAAYGDAEMFRSRVIMAKHGFGRGEYRYFDYPLPFDLATLRATLYDALVPLANRWNERLKVDARYPAMHREFLARCQGAGQARPTPLLLKYGAGDYNCLHRDLYGDLVFPLQSTVLLSEPGREFDGGEFMLVEQRPRMQSRGEVVPLAQGDAVIFAVNQRPVKGSRGFHRTAMRHGVSVLRRGERFVYQPLPRSDYDMVMDQVKRWKLDDYLKETSFEKLVYRAPATV